MNLPLASPGWYAAVLLGPEAAGSGRAGLPPVAFMATVPTAWVVGLVLVAVGVAWVLHRRSARLDEQRNQTRSRQMTDLIEKAQCVLWEADVQLETGDWTWRMRLHPSVFCRDLFRDRMPEPGHDLWEDFQIEHRAAMDRRARNAMVTGRGGYEQEFRAERAGQVYWLHENVSITQLGPDRFWLVGLVTDLTAQREAEAAQQQSEQTNARILTHARCMIWRATVVEQDGRLRWPHFDCPDSQLSELLFGPDRTYAPSRGFWDRLSMPDQAAMDARSTAAILSGAAGYAQEFRAGSPAGRQYSLHEEVSITREGPGRWSLVGVVLDVTPQREAEAARVASEQRLQELLARADCLLWEATVTLVGSTWKWQFTVQPSVLCERLYGTSLPTPDQGLWRKFDIPERAEMNTRCREALEGGRTQYDQQFHILQSGGRETWISENVTISPLGPDRFSLVGVAMDITALHQAELALAEEKERLAVTLQAMSEAVITTDVSGRIQFMNPAAETLTGWESAACIGRQVQEVCRLQGSTGEFAAELAVARVAQGQAAVDLPALGKLLTRAGLTRLVRGCCAPIHGAGKKVAGAVLVLHDVTEQERLEQELVRATRLDSVGVLAGGIAHDFNNILTAVMGNLTLAQLELAPGHAAAPRLQAAEKAAVRARDLTQQLLTFAKGGDPVRSAIHLEQVVRETTTFALHGSPVKAHFDITPDLWPADADKGQIGRVVQNLVINATQAMPQGGNLRISIRNAPADAPPVPGLAPGRAILVTIADTGMGIEPENLARIFDPYFTTKTSGTGLGLAAVYSIIRKHRGHIEAESQPGQGTTFRFWLPAHADSAPAATPAAAVAATPGVLRGRVLFMDDEPSILLLAGAILSRLGLETDGAADGAEAVELYRTALAQGRRYDLVVMDLTVPGGMGGLAALTRMREIDPTVKAVVSSGYSSDPVLANYPAHGFAAVLAKPYEVAEVRRVLEALL